jgi:hypothetical protein
MPLLRPYVTPGLFVLGAGIGAGIVATAPSATEPREVLSVVVQEAVGVRDLRDGAVAVAGVGDSQLVVRGTKDLSHHLR